MGKRFEIGGKYFRVRRGKLVEIPEKWEGVVASKQTIRKRQSKLTRKQKNQGFGKAWKNPKKDVGWGTCIYLRRRRGEDVFNEVDEHEM